MGWPSSPKIARLRARLAAGAGAVILLAALAVMLPGGPVAMPGMGHLAVVAVLANAAPYAFYAYGE